MKKRHLYHVNYVTFNKELGSFDVAADNWEELATKITNLLPEEADYVCSIAYNNLVNNYYD